MEELSLKTIMIDKIKERIAKSGIDVDFRIEDDSILTPTAGIRCSGFFEENANIKPTLGINRNLDLEDFVPTLAHEYCHFTQFREGSDYWKMSRLQPNDIRYLKKNTILNLDTLETGDILSMWISHQIEVGHSVIVDMTMRTIAIEADCERRTLEFMKELKIHEWFPSGFYERYTQKANAYIYQHYLSLNTRSETHDALYLVESVWSKMPSDKVTTDFYELEFCLEALSPEAVSK